MSSNGRWLLCWVRIAFHTSDRSVLVDHLDHLDVKLLLLDDVQDLYSTNPTQETS